MLFSILPLCFWNLRQSFPDLWLSRNAHGAAHPLLTTGALLWGLDGTEHASWIRMDLHCRSGFDDG